MAACASGCSTRGASAILEAHGYRGWVEPYVDATVSPENMLLCATRAADEADDTEEADGDGVDALVDWLEDDVGGPVDLSAAAAGYAAAEAAEAAAAAFVPVASSVRVDEEGWAAAAARSLEHNGFAVVRRGADGTPLVPREACDRCADLALAQLDTLLEAARRAGIRPRRDVFRFREICSRRAGGLRYDMRVPVLLDGAAAAGGEGDASWAEVQEAAARWARPVLERCTVLRNDGERGAGESGAGVVDAAGCVVALPGAPDQHFHPDGTARGLVNCFIPLVDVDAALGPTELRPGSHVKEAKTDDDDANDGSGGALDESPLLAAGELLLFDYRCLHRGRANLTRDPRPIAYVLFARPGVVDRHNFPEESVFDASPAAAS